MHNRQITTSVATPNTQVGLRDSSVSRAAPQPIVLPRRVITPRLAETTAGQRYEAPVNELGGRLHLHLNENLLGPAAELPAGLLKLESDDLVCYPGGGARELELAIAEAFAVPREAVHLGLGASGLLNQVFAAFANCKAEALLPTPTWSYYHTVMGACAIDWRAVPMRHLARSFEYDVDALVAAAVQRTPDLVLITSPNNPTGTRLSYAEILRIARAVPESLVVIDEAYYGFGEDDPIAAASLLRKAPNLMLLRTFSKAFGLAGLRVGFALAGPLGTQLLQRQPVPFGVPSFAQRIAAHRVLDRDYLARIRVAAAQARSALVDGLAEHPGFEVYDSAANFVLLKVGHMPTTKAQALLRERGYEVKRFGSGELEGFLRVTLAVPEIMTDLARTLLAA